MKIDLQLESNDDIEYFKTLFVRNVGIQQMMYEFHADDIMVRVQISALEGAQMISVGFFTVEKQGNSTTINQIFPLADCRYTSFKVMQDIWQWNAFQAWGTFTHGEQGIESAFETLKEILCIVYKVNKLKAFV